jgi:hypothetical protein
MEGLAAGGTEVVPAVIADLEQVQIPLFLMDLDPMDLPFALEASKDSEEGLGSGNRSEGSGSEGSNDRSFGAMDGDAMIEQVPDCFPFYHVFLSSPLVFFFSFLPF